jgi:hypothetical protein
MHLIQQKRIIMWPFIRSCPGNYSEKVRFFIGARILLFGREGNIQAQAQDHEPVNHKEDHI